MIRKSVIGMAVFLLAVPALADKQEEAGKTAGEEIKEDARAEVKVLDDRMMHAASILQEMRGPLEEDPPGVLEDAYAVAVFPEFVKVGLLGGVKHGRGVLAKRHSSGAWSKPAFVRLTKGSFGLQFGISMSQLILVFKHPKAVEAISGGQLTIGADAAYAAGDLGGMASAGTDGKLENQVVAVARSKGLFAGAALEGGVLRIERDANVQFYNDAIGLDGRRLLEDTEVELPPVAQHFLIVLDESVPPVFAAETETTAGSDAVDVHTPQTDSLQPADSEALSYAAQPAGPGLRNQAAGAAPISLSVPVKLNRSVAQRPVGAAASAPAATISGGGKAASWVTPQGAELPPGSAAPNTAALAVEAPVPSVAQAASRSVEAASWVTPQVRAPTVGLSASGNGPPAGAGVAGKVAGTLAGVALDGAKELALESARNTPEARGAKIALRVGKELASGKEFSTGPAAPKGLGQVRLDSAPDGAWVQPGNPGIRVASGGGSTLAAAPQTPPALADMKSPALSADAPLTVEAPSLTVSAENLPGLKPGALNARKMGPPPPSDWPEAWRKAKELAGACEPTS